MRLKKQRYIMFTWFKFVFPPPPPRTRSFCVILSQITAISDPRYTKENKLNLIFICSEVTAQAS